MNLVTHKYTPAEMSDQELEATFAAREHTVDYLVKALRDQTQKGTLSSYVITGPRGAGKSTIIQMVDLRIRQDAELSSAWITVIFPEEQFNMTSLRDMLAATLQILGKQNIPGAQEWLGKVEAELNEEQSEQLAVTGLRDITRQTGRRLVLFIENLDHLLEDYLNDKMKGTLRRLLMSDAFMMIVGSTVHIFDALKDYDEAFFNYFGQVPLDRLNADQVSELLRKRAEYDHNERFLRELPKQQAKVKTLVHLTGGNPRFVLMLYELLSLQQVTTIVQYLRRLVDELTPLLKDEMENLPPQQRKIIHALMERGGTAQPTDLTGPTRLPLNAITTQLKRLKDAQIVEVLGGGKGRAANYTVPDKLFSIWYQMRYLSQNRRRIELFVEVLRVWFEEEERIQTLRKLAEKAQGSLPHVLRECATTVEYFAASLKGTPHERDATDLCVDSWVKADLREAALALADLSQAESSTDDVIAQAKLAGWLSSHDSPQKAIEVIDQLLKKSPSIRLQSMVLTLRGISKVELGDNEGAISDFTALVGLDGAPKDHIAAAFFIRAFTKSRLGDEQAALTDYTALIEMSDVPQYLVASAFVRRGLTKSKIGNEQDALDDYTAAIKMDGASAEDRGLALSQSGFLKWRLGDLEGARADADRLILSEGAPRELIAKALFLRSGLSLNAEKIEEAIDDFNRVLESGSIQGELLSEAGRMAFALLSLSNNENRIQDTLARFARSLNLLTVDNARTAVFRFFSGLASPEMKVAWPIACRGLIATLKPETAEAIRFLEPVCEVLEGGDRTLLDSLPPEQREFAVEVLTKFEPKPESEPANTKITKPKRRKRTSSKK